jgi:hypothetical protein
VLLEGNSLAAVHGPHVNHLHHGRLPGTLVLPPVAPERHDRLTISDERVNAARWEVDDVTTAGEAVWSGVHGHTTLELTGFFGSVGRDPVRSYSEILTRMSIGLGDHALATARSLSTARRRAVRADRAEATHLG